MCTDMCADMHTHMCIDMCADVCADMCTDMRRQRGVAEGGRVRHAVALLRDHGAQGFPEDAEGVYRSHA